MLSRPGQAGPSWFFWELGTLVGGTAAGYTLALSVTPLLTRLISPVEMGVFGSFTAVVSMLSVVLTMGYEMGILGASRREALRLTAGVLGLSAVGAALAALVMALVRFLVEDAYAPWFGPAAALTALLANALSAFQYWYIRENQLRRVAASAFSVTGLRSLANLAGAALTGSALGLALGDMAGRAIGILVIDKGLLLRRACRELFFYKTACATLLWKQRRYPIFQMPSAVLDSVIFWAPTPLVAALYGVEAAGQFALVQRLLAAPSALIGKALSDLYQQRAKALRQDRGGFVRLTLSVIGIIMIVVLPVWFALLFWASELFTLVFGPGWTPASHIAQILMPLAGLQMASSIMTRMLLILDRQKIKFIFSVLSLSTLLFLFATGRIADLTLPALLQALVALTLVQHVGLLLWTLRDGP